MSTVEKTASKYSVDQVARMRELAPLNQAKATALAAEFGPKFTARSVTAKAVREGIAYESKGKVTKTGTPVEQKDAIVAEIASLVEANLDGLEKAPKPALQALRNYLLQA
jgi:hypothetical protein